RIFSPTRQSKLECGEPEIMKAILLAGIAAVLLATSAAWPRRPALPGDQFQLAASSATMAQLQVAQGDRSHTDAARCRQQHHGAYRQGRSLDVSRCELGN